jgi:type II secretory pathway pseudopilin PulG
MKSIKFRSGITMIEVVIVISILGLAVMPIYRLIVGSRIRVTKASFSYIALLLAREKMEEMISMPFDALKSQPWDKVTGPVVSEDLMKLGRDGKTGGPSVIVSSGFSGGFSGGERVSIGGAGKSVLDHSIDVGEGDYPLEYSRFERQVKITKKGNRFKHIEVGVRWYEAGEGQKVDNRYLYSLRTLVADHRLSAYK